MTDPDASLQALCVTVRQRVAEHHAAIPRGNDALCQAGIAVAMAADLLASARPTTMDGIRAKARIAYLLACDGAAEPASNGLVHLVMIALIRDLI